MRVLSVGSLIPLGITATIAAFDWLMSLTPTWYSSMYGFYFMTGSLLAGVALVSVLATVAVGRRAMPELKPSHYYALGRLLLAFTILWGYVAFFQFMLIWIGNRPDEGVWFLQRQVNSWSTLSIVLVLGQFGVPFFYLLSHRLKQGRVRLGIVAAWLLIFHYVDMYWLVMPAHDPGRFSPNWVDGATLLGVAASLGTIGLWLARGHPLVPVGDPALESSFGYESR